MNNPLTWVEINLSAYSHNIAELCRIASSEARLMAVVKADGYGHGAVAVARVALESGADCLGVARLHEAVELREAGIAAPILIFGLTPAEEIDTLLDLDLTQAVFSQATAGALAAEAVTRGKRPRVHIKVDTGMGRLGLLTEGPDAKGLGRGAADHRLSEVETIANLQGLEVEGLFTHFATADHADKTYANRQLQRFLELVDRLRQQGLEFPLSHAANSAALIDMPDSNLDMVRPGIATYGLYPSAAVDRSRVGLKPVMEWKTKVVQLKKVPAGFGVSYGITHETPRPTNLATVAVGYADGLKRGLSSRGQMLVGGQRVPIVGRICMDLTLLDVGEVPGASVGDEVVILGRQGDEMLSADEMATTLGTINYEIVSTITSRVPRIYLR
ncbi:MAG: alanine racemase [Nitrospirae bacterium]|nr:alanine racemase [Nitrospirota bacterium]